MSTIFLPTEAQRELLRELLRLLEARRADQQPVRVLVMKGFPYNSCSGIVAQIYRDAMREKKP